MTGLAQRLKTPLLILLILVCAFILVQNFTSAARIRAGRAFLVIGTLVFFVVFDYFLVGSLNTGATTLILVSAAVWSIGPTLEDMRVFGWISGWLAAVTLGLSVWWPAAWQQEDEKGFFGEEVLAGPFSQMNVLGIALAVLLPWTLTLKTGRMRALAFVATSATLVLAASRTSLIAAGLSAVVMIALRYGRAKKSILIAGVIAISAAVVMLPLETSDRSAFTARGGIWLNTREFIADSWLSGHGLRTFAFGGPLFQITHAQAAHAHNLFLQFVAMLGVAGLLGLLILLLTALRTATRSLDESVIPAGAFVAILALGVAEVPLRVEVFDGAAWIVWPVFLSLAFMRLDPAERTELTAPDPTAGTRERYAPSKFGRSW